MCNVFLNYVLGRDHNLTYQNTKISAVTKTKYTIKIFYLIIKLLTDKTG